MKQEQKERLMYAKPTQGYTMRHVQLKYVPNLKKYTVVKIEENNAIKCINTYAPDHPSYKMEHKSIYITYDRLIELQTIAMENGYMFVY